MPQSASENLENDVLLVSEPDTCDDENAADQHHALPAPQFSYLNPSPLAKTQMRFGAGGREAALEGRRQGVLSIVDRSRAFVAPAPRQKIFANPLAQI